MLTADFFSRFGMLVVERFLDEKSCRMLRHEAAGSAVDGAAVWQNGRKAIDVTARRTARAKVTRRTEAFVRRKLAELRPTVERHFGVALRGTQTPQFLIYRRGDFFECHTDDNDDPGSPRYLRERRISTVLFLNGERRTGERAPSPSGGLTFPGLIDDPRLASRGFRVLPETGLLIAFPSSVPHAVSPVTRGARYTVVSWYV